MPIRSESTPETRVSDLREIFRLAQQPLGESPGESPGTEPGQVAGATDRSEDDNIRYTYDGVSAGWGIRYAPLSLPDADPPRDRASPTTSEDTPESEVASSTLGYWELCIDSSVIRCRELESLLSPEYIPVGPEAPVRVKMTDRGRPFRAFYRSLWSALVANYERGYLELSYVSEILRLAVRTELYHEAPVEVNEIRNVLRDSMARHEPGSEHGRPRGEEDVPEPLTEGDCRSEAEPRSRRQAERPAERPDDRTDYTSKYRHLFTDKVMKVFKEEGIAEEEAIRVLSRMFARGEASTSVLMNGSFIFRYCDDRRYLMNKILNRVAAERAYAQPLPTPGTEAEGNDFDPNIDMLTGRPVGL